MPELSDSTPPINPAIAAMLRDPEDTSPPPNPAGFPWEQHHAFRFAFLMNFTQPRDREAFEHFGNLLYDMALECSDKWPDWPESPTRAELRAVALDLRHAAAFLASIGEERNHSSLSQEDDLLCYMATTWGYTAANIARGIESVLPPDRGEKVP